jgi:uncharacterized damage-inducible protein DinB
LRDRFAALSMSNLPRKIFLPYPLIFPERAMQPPQYPAGPFQPEEQYDQRRRAELIAEIEAVPARLRGAIAGLSPEQLDTPYKNWTIRQIVHHLADSHVHSYIRFKWALTEEVPTIKAYDEGQWAVLDDAQHGDIEPPLALLEGLHRRWVQLLRSMTPEQFERRFFHPESRQHVSLASALASYAWHGKHHTGQIIWLREHKLR